MKNVSITCNIVANTGSDNHRYNRSLHFHYTIIIVNEQPGNATTYNIPIQRSEAQYFCMLCDSTLARLFNYAEANTPEDVLTNYKHLL